MRKIVFSPYFFKWQSGQALLVIVLVMVVALTAALSVAIRTTTNIRLAEEEENSQKAFSAAEAGLEQSLVPNPTPISGGILEKAVINTQIVTDFGSAFLVNNGTSVLKDEPVDVWLSDYLTYTSQWSGNLTILWGSSPDMCVSVEDNNTQAALEILVLSGLKTDPKLVTYAFDPCSPRRGGNNFDSPSSASSPGDNIGNTSFSYKVSLPTITSGLFVRIVPLYASTRIGVKGSSAFPTQGKVISSTGTFDTSQRKIVSFRGFPQLPIEIFPFIIFSPK